MNAKTILALAFAGLFAATAATAASTGVTINDTPLDDAVSTGDIGWVYDSSTKFLTLTNAGPFTIAGANTAGKVQVVVQEGVTTTITLSNLRLSSSTYNYCALSLETNACVSLLLAGNNNYLSSGTGRAGIEVPAGTSLSITNAPGDTAANLETRSSGNGAGIGGGYPRRHAGTITISGGTIKSVGSYDGGAGIGGGSEGNGGVVTISGGTVTAIGGGYAAGIGSGKNNSYSAAGKHGGTVNISGGVVTATGDYYAAGIGGGYYTAGATLTVSGGTVIAKGVENAVDIGSGANGTTTGANTFTGGSISLVNKSIAPAPSNGTGRLACVTVSDLTPNAPVTIEGLDGYGVNDIVADDYGAIHLWLPDGTYHFTANGKECSVRIKNGAGPSGVTVNGEEAVFGPDDPGAGWDYDATTCTLWLMGAGPFTLSGANELGNVRVVVSNGVASTVTLSNLTLKATAKDQCVFALEENSNVSLVLAGANTLASGENCAGLAVAAGRTLAITNAPGDATASLAATGGNGGAGIGGGKNAAGGTIMLAGGRITATSSYQGAGIGGGYQGAGGTVTIDGGVIVANGGSNGAGIGGGSEGAGGTVAISDGTVTARGGYQGAGIGGGYWSAGGTVDISGGTVTASGGQYGAGIGGGNYGHGGTTIISNGTVAATGGYRAAGIGGGDGKAGGNATISGGLITATGGSSGGAGIGGGNYGAGGSVAVSGGTVAAQGTDGGADIGPGLDGMSSGANTFTGGSIGLAASSIALAPSNGTARVGYIVESGFTPGDSVVIEGLGDYGVNDIFADANGAIHLWLPDGTYNFTANGRECSARIKNGSGPIGVTINGEDVAFTPDDPEAAGWSYDVTTGILWLTGAGSFTLSGNDALGRVCVVVSNDVASTVALSNLTLTATAEDQCAFALRQNARVSLVLAGENALASGRNRAGLEVPPGASLSITNAPGGGSLTATSDYYGAGIGGGYNSANGTVKIYGGTVTATGGYRAAGIGGGYYGDGGTVWIGNGTVVANGGNNAAGIGGGYYGDGGTVNISGGAVTATGGNWAAGIGSGYYGDGGTVTIADGVITATGGSYGAGIGGGYYGNSGTVTISGGAITAKGGSYAAGIGSGSNAGSSDGTVTISGGTVTATGGRYGAGLGGGDQSGVGTINISGGRVTAKGYYSAGIGGGRYSTGGTVNIAGGTVSAQGNNGGADIGPGISGSSFGSNTFTGGSIRLVNDTIDPPPSDGLAPVVCVTLTGFEPNAAVMIAGLAGYGVNDLVADNGGALYLWLPDGKYDFTANGRNYTLELQGGVLALGVSVNGTDVAFGPNDPETDGWNYQSESRTVLLYGTGPFTLSGANETGDARVAIMGDAVNTVTLSNLTLKATGQGQCAFALQEGAQITLILAGTNTLVSGENCAGLEVTGGNAITITRAPGDDGASLTATGGANAAGIGGGQYGGAGAITIAGGRVSATGGTYGAGIGGGHEGAGGAVMIAGGTVAAQGGYGGADIGPGLEGAVAGTNTFTGGSIRLDNDTIAPAPSNGTARVACVALPDFECNAPVTINGLEDYGVNDLVADDCGTLYLWLPDGEHVFTANGNNYAITLVRGGQPKGVTVNGEDAGFGPENPDTDGWTYDAKTRTLSLAGTGPFTLAGTNVSGGVCVVIPDGTTNTVMLSNLTLRATGDNQCAFALEHGARVSLVLAGKNTLASGCNRAGLEVPLYAELSITNAPGDEAASLAATGGDYGAGIGSGHRASAGTMRFLGGAVTAIGGSDAAGVGGGGTSDRAQSTGGRGGTVAVHGGTLVATGSGYSAGIGSGYRRAPGRVHVYGGTVTATAGAMGGAGIGSGAGDEYRFANYGGAVNIEGGRVTATAGRGGAGIGGGYKGAGCNIAISGGTVTATGRGGASDIGRGLDNTLAVLATTFTGGSIRLAGDTTAPAPSNGTDRVWCVTVPGFTPNAAVVVTALGAYGTDDLVADNGGRLYLWLPNGTYDFTAGGRDYTASVSDAAATATSVELYAPVFATDGSALVFSGTTLAIKLVNVQKNVYYTLYATDALGGEWTQLDTIRAENDGDLTFTILNATAPKRFFKVEASKSQP